MFNLMVRFMKLGRYLPVFFVIGLFLVFERGREKLSEKAKTNLECWITSPDTWGGPLDDRVWRFR